MAIISLWRHVSLLGPRAYIITVRVMILVVVKSSATFMHVSSLLVSLSIFFLFCKDKEVFPLLRDCDYCEEKHNTVT